MSIDNFTGKAEAYAFGRPSYPIDSVEHIIKLKGSKAKYADIGAGTGRLTKLLAERDCFVYAVEPNDDMRGQLELMLAQCKNVEVISGTAEDTTLEDNSVDVLTIAHALHWFDLNRFMNECIRILKPNGIIVVVYNHRPGMQSEDYYREKVDELLNKPLIREFPNPMSYSREKLHAYLASQDDLPVPGDAEYEAYIAKVNADFDRDSENGLLLIDRLTVVYNQQINIESI